MNEKDFCHAPVYYDNSEASAWASGYNSCLNEIKDKLQKKYNMSQEEIESLFRDLEK